MPKQRLDEVLIGRGDVGDEIDAFIAVTEGRVFVNGQKAISPSQEIGEEDRIEVKPVREFVGRGAEKLNAALAAFGIDAAGKTCADVGAATGGFTEVLLKRGAKRVYAIDAGRGKLDPELRADPRVTVLEGTNVLSMKPLPERMDIITVDVSLISLRRVLPIVRGWLAEAGSAAPAGGRASPTEGGRVIALFKPQYEVIDKRLLRHGVLEDEAARGRTLEKFRSWLAANNWREIGMMESPIRGSEGNAEYLFYLKPS